jgi:hypothetical protein
MTLKDYFDTYFHCVLCLVLFLNRKQEGEDILITKTIVIYLYSV